MIDVHAAACVMCADAPCISACEPRVLRRDQPLKMGVAWIQPMACLAHNGSFCTVCSERCPVPGAIRLDGGRPSIDAGVCTGCGTCAYVCPAPSNAVVVMPLADRPAPVVVDESVGRPLAGGRDWAKGVIDGDDAGLVQGAGGAGVRRGDGDVRGRGGPGADGGGAGASGAGSAGDTPGASGVQAAAGG